MKTFNGLIVPSHEPVYEYDDYSSCALTFGTDICMYINCRDCLFDYHNFSEYQKWSRTKYREEKLKRILNENV